MSKIEKNSCKMLQKNNLKIPWYINKEGKRRGVIKMFQKEGEDGVKYIYAPINLESQIECDEWNDKIMNENEELTWMRDIFWKLEKKSCVLVKRNKF